MNLKSIILSFITCISLVKAQFFPKHYTKEQMIFAQQWVDTTYNNLNQDERLGQLFIVALYTNKGEKHIEEVSNIIKNDKIGGIILMQDDAERQFRLVRDLQKTSKIPMLVGIDAEWGLYQRFSTGYKFPWAITLGAIQNKNLIYQMAKMIANDCKNLGINWNFAPVVDVNTNSDNPIIGNRSFGSDVDNVTISAINYANGLQDQNVMASIKHFPGHGDTNTDSHLDLPTVNHPISRLNSIELAPFNKLINNNIGGIMVAHIYVPALEKQKNTPASISKTIVTDLLKNKLGYKGIIITDALNMGAVAKKYPAGELDALAFKAGNDIMLFSQAVSEGKKLIQKAIDSGEIPQQRVEESVKKILLTKYFLGLDKYSEPKTPSNINKLINTNQHRKLSISLYENAITLLKNDSSFLPLQKEEKYYFLPMEEAGYSTLYQEINKNKNIILITEKDLGNLPKDTKIIISLHKDNSTAYKPYKISDKTKNIIYNISKKYNILLNIQGSPYALKDLNINNISSVLISYENNEDAMTATAHAMLGETNITGRLSVSIGSLFPSGSGIDLIKK